MRLSPRHHDAFERELARTSPPSQTARGLSLPPGTPISPRISAALACLGACIGLCACASTADDKSARADIRSAALERLAEAAVQDPSLAEAVRDAHGFAVFPEVDSANAADDGVCGKGVVYQNGWVVGYCDLRQDAAQAAAQPAVAIADDEGRDDGGEDDARATEAGSPRWSAPEEAPRGSEVFTQIIFFEDYVALKRFKFGDWACAREGATAAAPCAVASKKYDEGVKVFVMDSHGRLARAPLGRQTFRYHEL